MIYVYDHENESTKWIFVCNDTMDMMERCDEGPCDPKTVATYTEYSLVCLCVFRTTRTLSSPLTLPVSTWHCSMRRWRREPTTGMAEICSSGQKTGCLTVMLTVAYGVTRNRLDVISSFPCVVRKFLLQVVIESKPHWTQIVTQSKLQSRSKHRLSHGARSSLVLNTDCHTEQTPVPF